PARHGPHGAQPHRPAAGQLLHDARPCAAAPRRRLRGAQGPGRPGHMAALSPWPNHFLALARYHAWATRRLLDAVAPLSDEAYRREVGLFCKSVHGTLNHLLVGETLLWFRRFAHGESPALKLGMEAEPD